MAALDEQLVEEWLNRAGFFTVRGVKVGLSEIDLLAIKPIDGALKCKHVEVQISFSPIGYIGGSSSAKRRTPSETQDGVKEWVDRKFQKKEVVRRRDEFVQGAKWEKVLVHEKVRHPEELTLLSECGVTLKPYIEILDELMLQRKSTSSSSASGIADILKYMSGYKA